MKKDLQISSKRQYLRLWYECYQLCLMNDNYKDNLKKSKHIYKNWGNVKNLDFSTWYKKKEYLFDRLYVREIDEIVDNPNTMNINIPLYQPMKVIQKEVKELIEKKRKKEFKFTYTKNFKGVFRYINLEIYKIYLKLKKPPINRNFLIEVRKNFDSRTRSKIKTNIMLPTLKQMETQFPTNVSLDNFIRTVRRGIKEVEKTIENVSKGKFP